MIFSYFVTSVLFGYNFGRRLSDICKFSIHYTENLPCPDLRDYEDQQPFSPFSLIQPSPPQVHPPNIPSFPHQRHVPRYLHTSWINNRKQNSTRMHLHVPSNAIARYTNRWTAPLTRSSSSSSRKSIKAWKFPSPTWPTIVLDSPESARSRFVSRTSCGRRDTGTLKQGMTMATASGDQTC